MSTNQNICVTEHIAAYVDGELESSQRTAFEEHIKQCSRCASELQAQRRFMCELDSALASPFDLAVPQNFAQVVAVHAESDMRGVRNRSEHTRALLNVRSVAEKIFGVFGLFVRTTFDAAAGFTVISRVVSRGLIPDSRVVGLAGLFLVILAIAILSLLISRYHRTRVVE